MLEWIRTSTKSTDVTMSVCTGAYVLARTGLLSGKSATTFHRAYEDFAVEFPDIQLKRGARFVEDGNLASSGGLTSGIDLAFRTIDRHNESPKPFIWTARAADILEKVKRARRTLNKRQSA
jgi:transcriptional regulator GlxA family with amidase domain